LLIEYLYRFIHRREKLMKKIAIIGSGPCGLSMLRAFEHAEKMAKKYPK